MKKYLSILIVLIIAFGFSSQALALTRVKGYVKKNGTYVAPHYKTDKDSTKLNNWSTKYNSNPFTGKKGYVNPYKIKY